MDLKGKTVAITGGATGIGFALAKQFGAKGANIVIGEPRQGRLNDAVAALKAEGYNAAATILDVTDLESMEAFADFAYETFGTVNIAINNAGISVGRAPITAQSMEDVRKLFDVNFFGVWHGAAVFGRRMMEQDEPAAIYNVGSENAFFVAVPFSSAYVASKHAVRGLTLSLKEEFEGKIHVGLICPGWVASEIMPPEVAKHAMDTDQFAEKVIAQISADEFWIVSHAYNVERYKPIHEEIDAAFAKYAPRYDGDEEYDVRTFIAKMMGG